ncbi:MAG TPA: ParB-like protein [Steroidobacteraceae bacterium]|nr:ParB-like protein [Steroidobacteraceae bacterium]
MQRTYPMLITLQLRRLRPTQITVGMEEVAYKRQEWRQLGRKARAATLAAHWFPCILGPGEVPYIVDHHHFGLALMEEGVEQASGVLLKDLSWVDVPAFWVVMDHHQWVHPYDRTGKRRDFKSIPKKLGALDRVRHRFGSALKRAEKMAHSAEARYLPGWSGKDAV